MKEEFLVLCVDDTNLRSIITKGVYYMATISDFPNCYRIISKYNVFGENMNHVIDKI